MSENLAEIEKIIKNLNASEKSTREPSELIIEQQFEHNRDSIVKWLSQLFCHSSDLNVRMTSIVVLRRQLNKGEPTLFEKIQPQTQDIYKSALLHSMLNEKSAKIKLLCVESIANISQFTLSKGTWTELLPFIKDCCNHKEAIVRGSAYDLLGKLTDMAFSFMSKHLNSIADAMKNGLLDKDLSVRMFALKSTLLCIQTLEETHFSIFTPLIPQFLAVFEEALTCDDVELQLEAFEEMVDMATINPHFIRDYLDSFIKLMTNIGTKPNFDTGVRSLAIEFIVTIAEGAGGMTRKSKFFVESSFSLGLSFLCTIEDDPEWSKNLKEDDDDGDDEKNKLYSHGLTSLDRLAQTFGSERTVKVALPMIQQFLTRNEWVYRFSALMATSQIVECIDESHLNDLVRLVLPYFKDNHPRVRFGAVHCIGQMCNDFSPKIQNDYYKEILPNLCMLIGDASNARVQGHAAAALINFASDIDKKYLMPYLPEMLPALFNLFRNSPRIVQEQVITAVASIADTAGESFVQYFDAFMPVLIDNIVNLTQEEDALFRSKNLECACFIGIGVGKEKFLPFAKKIMEITTKDLRKLIEGETVFYDYVLQAWSKISHVLKEDFSHFLMIIMPFVFETAQLESNNDRKDAIQKYILENNDFDLNDLDYDPLASNIDEVESAISLLATLPSDVGAEYFAYLEKTVTIMLPLLQYWADTNIRGYAIGAIPSILESTILSHNKNYCQKDGVSKLFNTLIENLIKAIETEPEPQLIRALLTSLCETIETGKNFALDFFRLDKVALKFVGFILQVVQKSQQRRENREKRRTKPDFDEETEKLINIDNATENKIIYRASECVGTLMKIMKNEFEPTFKQIAQNLFSKLSSENTQTPVKRTVLFIFDDAIDTIPDVVSPCVNALIPVFIKYTEFDDLDIKQASVYGLGAVSKQFKPIFQPFVIPSLEVCVKLIEQMKTKTDESSIAVLDNAVSSYGKIIFYHSNSVDVSRHFPIWLQLLPIKEDDLEAKSCNEMLCLLLKTKDTKFFGTNYDLIPRIVHLLSEQLGTESFSKESHNIFVEFCSSINTLPNHVQQAISNSLSTNARQKLANLGKV